MLKTQKTNNVILYALVIIVSAIIMYIIEENAPIDDFHYFGNVTEKQTFDYPEPILLWSFGEMTDPYRRIDFINQLWCSPVGSPFHTKELIQTRVKHFPRYTFENELPSSVKEVLTEAVRISGQIGLRQRLELREADTIKPFLSWSMGDIRPLESSVCNVTVNATIYTTLFNLPREIEFTGHDFIYNIPTDISQKEH